MENTTQSVSQQKVQGSPGCLSSLGWFASGAVLPLGSLTFYRKAAQRPIGQAILFFFVFTIVLSILSTLALGAAMLGLTREIRAAYERGDIPEISISNGIAQVDGPQPFILFNESTSSGAMLVAVDTTGQISSIDRSRYYQGFLLTRTELHVLNQYGRYERLSLRELNRVFERDPLIIDGETVSNAWVSISVVVLLVYLILLILWNSIARLMFIAMVALVLWGIGSLFRSGLAFADFVIGGLYGMVPAIYLSHVLDRLGASFFGLQMLLLGFFWLLALVACLAKGKFFRLDNPPRLWTALIGVPMLILLVVDLFIATPSTAWMIVLGMVTFLTGIALVGLRLLFHFKDMQPSTPENPPPVTPA